MATTSASASAAAAAAVMDPPAAAEEATAKTVHKRYEGLMTVRTKAIKGKGAWYWAHLEPILVQSSDTGLPKAVKLRCSLCDAIFSASNHSRTASEHLKRGTCPNFTSPSSSSTPALPSPPPPPGPSPPSLPAPPPPTPTTAATSAPPPATRPPPPTTTTTMLPPSPSSTPPASLHDFAELGWSTTDDRRRADKEKRRMVKVQGETVAPRLHRSAPLRLCKSQTATRV